MTDSRFVHLRVHTEYSLVDGMVRIKPLMQAVSERGMDAVAVTDFCNLFAALKTFQAALNAGVKPILGADLPCHDPDKPADVTSVVLLCQNLEGYRNLTRLVSKAYLEGQHQGAPRIHYDWLTGDATDGLIALSGACRGEVGQALLLEDDVKAHAIATRWAAQFPGRFYLEIQRTDRPDEAMYNEQVVKLADALNLPLVATNDVCFLDPFEFDAHEARVCIHEGYTLADKRRPKKHSNKQSFRSADAMCTLFADLPQAIENTVEISKRCTVDLPLGEVYLPSFPMPDGFSEKTYLTHLAEEGLVQRMKKAHLSEVDEAHQERLKIELSVIHQMGFSGYFLIVSDFIQWAKKEGIPVGPGRGSGAGSLVAYVLQITDLDPLQYDLLFERFLNPERVSMPDFDIDFCMDGRDRVIDYVATRYGRDSVSQIITFGTMAAKAVIRDVGRVLGHPYGFVDKLAKLIPFEIGITLKKAMEQEAELERRYAEEEEVKNLINLALSLEGITRNAGKHAGGVVIAPSALTDFTAVYCEQGSTQQVSQLDKDDVEAAGLVKFDFLGLKTLTIIDCALKTVNAVRAKDQLDAIRIEDIPLDDAETLALLNACQTTSVFQLESRGMKDLVHRLQPDSFEDIIALVALYRPGPLQSGMVDDFVERKHGRAPIVYLHPDLEPILQPTYGVILYQEQVMQIAQVLANYTLGAADLLRRAMGKKKPEEMAKQRVIFTKGATDRGIDKKISTATFDLMEKFAGYGFNKSHSAAYALVAYQTAWLKAHYPAAFMASVISADMDTTDKVDLLVRECKNMTLEVHAPSVQQGQYEFTVSEDNALIYGLGAIKGVGEGAIQSIIDARISNGISKDLFDFCCQVDLRRVNRRVLDALIKSGCFDAWRVERSVLHASLEQAMQQGMAFHVSQDSGQSNLFDLFDEEDKPAPYVDVRAWTSKQRLKGEKETLGFYWSGHPALIYQKELGALVQPIAGLNASLVQKVRICALVRGLRRIMTKRGKQLLILTLEDGSEVIDAVAFSEVVDAAETPPAVGEIIVLDAEVGEDKFTGGVRLTVMALSTMSEARARFSKYLLLNLTPDDLEQFEPLRALLTQYPGRCAVQVKYKNGPIEQIHPLPSTFAVLPEDNLLDALTALLKPEDVRVCY
ncbi:MAG: DNA polymerase III subunit alpha [Gammaproteobacteria bacterium]|nr:DNA polymerase III subunit alpha [Gammaproteobacteria bacterium]MCH9717927.1 DNA polymerase III subunit alpha [Gammaproteobacteria bacterium]MCH9763424.1 DNA polymerase III subunit alpha [Gammaproteobacteria bacterium]